MMNRAGNAGRLAGRGIKMTGSFMKAILRFMLFSMVFGVLAMPVSIAASFYLGPGVILLTPIEIVLWVLWMDRVGGYPIIAGLKSATN
jgi:hypothetical protein